MTGLQIYAVCWAMLEVMGLTAITYQLAYNKIDKVRGVANLIGVLISLPIYIAAFLYIFKIGG